MSITLALTGLALKLAPFADEPNPNPTINFNFGGDVPDGIERPATNIVATALLIGAAIALIGAIIIGVRIIFGAPKLIGRLFFALVLFVVLLAPSAMLQNVSITVTQIVNGNG